MLWLLLEGALGQQTMLQGQPIKIIGKATSGGVDFQVTYNQKQLLVMVFSIADQSADAIIFNYQISGTVVLDGFIQSDGSLVTDNIQNIRASALTLPNSAANGIKTTFARDLNTGDPTDFVLQLDTATQVCFFTASIAYSSGTLYSNSPKVCTYLSIHSAVGDSDDRLIGNLLQTTTYGGQTMIIYGSMSQQIGSVQNWLFLTIYYGAMQGSTAFTKRWLRVSPGSTFSTSDCVAISFTGPTIVTDNYCTSRNICDLDTNQGGSSDVFRILGGFNSVYQIVTFSRKFSTGDRTTDQILTVYSVRGLSIQIGNNEATVTSNAELMVASPNLGSFTYLPSSTFGTPITTQTRTNTPTTPIINRPVFANAKLLLAGLLCAIAFVL